MIFNLRKRELIIELKEKNIHKLSKDVHKCIEKDRRDIQRINKILSNGITLSISQATGGHK